MTVANAHRRTKQRRVGGADLRKLPVIAIMDMPENILGLTTFHNGVSHTAVPTVQISNKTRGKERLDVILHEAAHLAFPGMEEDVVRVLATYQAKVLWAMGYSADDEAMTENFKPKEA